MSADSNRPFQPIDYDAYVAYALELHQQEFEREADRFGQWIAGSVHTAIASIRNWMRHAHA